MCVNCFGQSVILNNGEANIPQVVIDCDITKESVRELLLAIETAFLKTKDKSIIPFVQEVGEYVEQFYTIGICDKLGRINVLRQEYL